MRRVGNCFPSCYLLCSEVGEMMQICQAILMLTFAVMCAGNTDGECGSEDSVLWQASRGKARTSIKSPVSTVTAFMKAMEMQMPSHLSL